HPPDALRTAARALHRRRLHDPGARQPAAQRVRHDRPSRRAFRPGGTGLVHRHRTRARLSRPAAPRRTGPRPYHAGMSPRRLALLVLLAATVLLEGCTLSRAQIRRADAIVAATTPTTSRCDRADRCARASPLLDAAAQALA